MSQRRSTGDLVPRDITEIIGREVRAQRGHRKPGSTLGQAFSWLRSSQKKKKEKKNKKTKSVDGGALIMTDGLQHHDTARACTKANGEQERLSGHYSASQHFQENVFIEGSRPQYLEDLHSEAQESLKIQQKEEHKSGVNFAENESTASSDNAHPEQDFNSKDVGASLEWKSNSGNTDTSRTCAVPPRPGLTRQGSTFKPLYPVKRLDKNKKRSRRTTIMGIPNQVQKELALHTGSSFQQVVSTNNNHQSGVFIIPTVGGTPEVTKEGARVHLSELKVTDKQQMRTHLKEVHEDEDPLHRPGFGRSSVLRPMSVADLGMTTFPCFNPSTSSFLLEPQGPVLSISPQATYLSTIIPNAVLPASIEVIEIDRSSQPRGNGVNSSGSVHAASQSSLASVDSSVSPLLSRRSDCSQMSNSYQNSTTEVCNSQGVDFKVQESQKDSTGGRGDSNLHNSVNLISRNRQTINDPEPKNNTQKKRNSTRSLSIIKTKQPPAPPQRSNSLHSDKIRINTKIRVDNKDDTASQKVETTTEHTASTDQLKCETSKISKPVSKSPSSPADTSAGEVQKSLSEINRTSPQKTPSEGEKFERTMSPSSGYSSQSGTPTLSPKEITPNAPDKDKKKPVKPERAMSRASSSASPSSSLTSLSSSTSEPVNSDVSYTSSLAPVFAKEPTLNLEIEVKELLNVPPPPKVKAPYPPPPETWAQNTRTIELLCGPSPKVSKVLKESTPIQESTAKHEDTRTKSEDLLSTESSEETSQAEKLPAIPPGDAHVDQNCAVTEQEMFAAEERIETIAEVQSQECRSPTVKDSGSCEISTKTGPPAVIKKPPSVLQTDESTLAATEVGSCELPVTFVDFQGIHEVSPTPSPPPDHQPTPPLLRKSHPISVSPVDLDRIQEQTHIMESSWPPPPPPLEGDSIFDGGDEMDFPLPPPPDVVDNVSAAMERSVTEIDAPIPPVEESVELIHTSKQEASEPPHLVLDPVVICDKKDEDTRSSCRPPSSINPPAALASSSNFRKRHSLDFEIQSTTEPFITVRLPSPVPSPSPLENLTAGVAFRKPPGNAHRDNRNKELLARHKSAPIPKEDANIPLVTPSLLQMVRLRSVSTTEDNEAALTENKSKNEGVEDISRQQSTPQKPMRKSIKSPPQVVKTPVTPSTPSMRLQEAIRIKTAALSSREGLPCRLGMRTSYHCANEPGILPLKSCNAYDKQKFHASTASFIFSRSAKRALEDQSPLSDQTNWVRSDRVPPPVARKPSHCSVGFSQEPNVATSDAQQHSKEIALPETTTRVTADTIETLF